MNQGHLKSILSVLLALIVTVYVVKSIEFYDKEQDVAESKEVRQQPFLATQKLLETHDVTMVFEQDYQRLYSKDDNGITPKIEDTVILADAEAAISSSLASSLLGWVEQGGFLIVSVNASDQSDSHRANALIQQLGIGVEWVGDESSLYSEYEQQISSMNDPHGDPIEVSLESIYRITFPEELEPFYSVSNEEGYTFVQFDKGEGLVTLMTDVQIWNNWQIDEYDNAILMLGLLEESDTVYLFKPVEQPHWFTLLYGHAPLFIWLVCVLILLAIWHFGKRFGSVSAGYKTDNSRFSEHIRVAGNHYWQHGQQLTMLTQVRNTILQRINQKWPNTNSTDQQKIVLLLEELSGWPTATIEQLMFDQKELNQNQYSHCIKGLQQLRKML
ncbi:DUF4350 domain-containing protein [uncultured Paraglaciecola sp.]|uniref:DUF4350 domain-containing protein n=1 Tax=uncultured Paraglaciecola sp. TaxID=1765024 RepID=UPI002595EBAB|nr:DUF4350 domain-containing protein [uncultured Paraglaciecola sp.]